MRAAIAFPLLAIAACDLEAIHPLGVPADVSRDEPRAAPVDEPPPTRAGGLKPCVRGVDAPNDPGDSVEGWSISGGTLIDNEGTSAEFSSSALCSTDAALSVNVEMPSCYLPLALRIETDVFDAPDTTTPNGTGVVFGGAPVDYFLEYQSVTRCLGERAFGGARLLEIRPRPLVPEGCAEMTAMVSDVGLVADAACPAPGDVVAFDQWTFQHDQRTARAELVDGSVELVTVDGCDFALASGPDIGAVSFPDADGVALEVVVDGDAAFGPGGQGRDGLFVMIGQRFSARLRGGTNIVCLPSGLRGTADRLSFILQAAGAGGLCNDPETMHAIVRPPAVVTGVCTNADIVDAAFDDPRAWSIHTGERGGGASIANGVATVSPGHGCDAPDVSTFITVPVVTDDGSGPSVRVRYSLAGGGAARIGSHLTAASMKLPPTGGGNAATTFCLPHGYDGEVIDLYLTAEAMGGNCDDVPANPPLLIVSELELGVDTVCAQAQ